MAFCIIRESEFQTWLLNKQIQTNSITGAHVKISPHILAESEPDILIRFQMMYLIKLNEACSLGINWFPVILHSELENNQRQNNLYS